MDSREYDIIVYGATGFTAGYVIKELECSTLKIAVSSRSFKNKLDTMFPKIECSIEDIEEITKKTKILINCVGSYTLYCEPIIKACINTSTHYLDICGGPAFLEKIYQKYDEEAKNKKTRIIQCCGFDSVPADLGVFYFNRNHKFSNIETIMCLSGSQVNVTTWESLLLSVKNFSSSNNTKPKRDTDKPKKDTDISKKDTDISKKENNKVEEYKFDTSLNAYIAKFRGSDPYIVKRSMKFFSEKGMFDSKVACYLKIGSLFNLIVYYFILSVLFIMCKFNLGFYLLKKFPGFFSCGIVSKNPSKEVTANSSFEMIFKAPNKDNTLVIKGPNPGYISTAILLTQSAYTLIDEENKVRYGVLTPAIAFYKTKIVDRLTTKGILFEQSY
jgi:short subunit dehydrogenase-like uncharacterized protein